jgi:hypothetical protein
MSKVKLCEKQVACDGETLYGASIERGYCGKCKKALDKRGKDSPKLKGEKK